MKIKSVKKRKETAERLSLRRKNCYVTNYYFMMTTVALLLNQNVAILRLPHLPGLRRLRIWVFFLF